MTRTRIVRTREWAYPVPPVRREVLSVAAAATGADPTRRPPLLFVPGFGHGAWVFGEHWLERAAARG
ncbi:MAG TPA: alpha/beta hydrolase, partial [Micromonosporaceae bacterium]|nr:alpha/beta hydrolase [Micromonosporaceae bacterium]